VITAQGLLELVARYVAPMIPPRNRMGTIDSGYPGSGWPRVVFDGEATVSAKAYAHVDAYTPAADDRVVLVPVGGTWLIIGSVS
jgi:hypothetical protein